MELIAFDHNDVENALYDITSAFQALSFALNGLKMFDQINDEELCGLEYIIREAHKEAQCLLQGMQPVFYEDNKTIVLRFCTDADENHNRI